MKAIHTIATILIIVGALNWGLIAAANFDLVAAIAGESFGGVNAFSRLVYGLVALAGLYEAAVMIGQVTGCGCMRKSATA